MQVVNFIFCHDAQQHQRDGTLCTSPRKTGTVLNISCEEIRLFQPKRNGNGFTDLIFIYIHI